MDDIISYLGSSAGLMMGGLGKMGRIVRLLYLLKQGKTRREIAGIFGVTRRSIYLWEHEAKAMLGADTTIELICWACKEGLFDLFEAQDLDDPDCEGGLGGGDGPAVMQ
jgi:transcriptional regulator with XRE-family HTH domain